MQDEQVHSKMEHFLANYREVTLKKGEILLRPYDEITNCYYIKSGFVYSYTVSASGNEFTTNVFRPTSIILLSAALSSNTLYCTCETLTQVTAVKIPSRDIRKFMKQESEVAFFYFTQFASALSQTCLRMEAIIFGTAGEKVASVLCLLQNRFELDPGKKRINLDFSLTHRQLASMTGLTRETVSSEMVKLKREKLIDYQSGNIEILDQEKLRDASSIGHYFFESSK